MFRTHLLNHKPLFSPDKYVECMWKNERSQKSSVSRVIRSDIPEILQNGSTLSPQRRNFQGGCKESLGSGNSSIHLTSFKSINVFLTDKNLVFSQASTRNLKTDNKRGSSTSTWSGFNKGFTNGYRSSNSASNDNSRNNGMGRRDSERVEPLPEWMDDGPVNNTEIMQLGGFNDQERLEQSFQKIGAHSLSYKSIKLPNLKDFPICLLDKSKLNCKKRNSLFCPHPMLNLQHNLGFWMLPKLNQYVILVQTYNECVINMCVL